MGHQQHAYRIVALGGEGVGPEVVEAAVQVLQAVSLHESFSLTVDHGLIGQPAIDACGNPLPAETVHLCEDCDGILFGAVSRHGILELRKHFQFYANLRPVRVWSCLEGQSRLRREYINGVDILFVRELISGIYFGPSGQAEDADGAFSFHTMLYHDFEIRRIARKALALAQTRRRHLTVAHKENALPEIPWCRLVTEEAQANREITVEPMLVDTLAMELVRNPQRFDVILASNLFGDILSDIGGAITGSIALLPSASFNEAGLGLYEAVHGTAPDIAGQGIANPMGMLGAVELMLQHWGESQAAGRLRSAQQQVLENGTRTADLVDREKMAYVTTAEFTAAVIRELIDKH